MGYLDDRIEQLAGNLFSNYCVGNPRFLNKKAIKADLAKILKEFIITGYQQHLDIGVSYHGIVTNNTNLVNLASRLQRPLLIVKPEMLGQKYGIDLGTDNKDYELISDLRGFFTKTHKMLGNNCKRFVKKRILLDSDDEADDDVDLVDINEILTENFKLKI